MKRILDGYAFNKATKQITFPSSVTVNLNRLLFVIDQTAGQIIYDPGVNGKGGVISGSVLTLAFDTNTASFANSDTLVIGYDDGETGSTEQSLQMLLAMFSALLERNESFSTAGSQWVQVTNTPSVLVAGTPTVNTQGAGAATITPRSPFADTIHFHALYQIAQNQLIYPN